MERVLVLGSGGREHALAWKLLQSPRVEKVFVAPGNPGMELTPGIETVKLPQFDDMAKFAQQQGVAFTVVGPEILLGEGVVDYFRERQLPIFGPTQAAAQLEISKHFAKELMVQRGVPTATFKAFTTQEFSLASSYVEQLFSSESETGVAASCVVKADGPMAGKGVFVCTDVASARSALDLLFEQKQKVLIEEKLEGPEVSAFYLCHGRQFTFLANACDYKRLYDGQRGPNTGGMGAYSPAPPWLTLEVQREIERTVVQPVLDEMAEGRGTPFTGTLFVGLMMTERGPSVLEFNTRFGDPETQVLMPLIESDLFLILKSLANPLNMNKIESIKMRQAAAVHVVMTAKGYALEGRPLQSGDTIQLIERASCSLTKSNPVLFASGMSGSKEMLTTKGGRVLGITAVSNNQKAARNLAYSALDQVSFEGAHFRQDIGEE